MTRSKMLISGLFGPIIYSYQYNSKTVLRAYKYELTLRNSEPLSLYIYIYLTLCIKDEALKNTFRNRPQNTK